MKSAILATLAAIANPALAGAYFSFYDNYECTGDRLGDTNFDSSNSGCFSLNGAKCAKAVGGTTALWIPVLAAYSAGGDCANAEEAGCNALSQREYDGQHLAFNNSKWIFADSAASYRFIQGDGSEAQCPTACSGVCPGGNAPARKRDSKPKSGDYAWYTSDDCSGEPGTSIEPGSRTDAGCQIEGDRGSVYNNNDSKVSLYGFRTADQSCPTGEQVDTITLQGKSCTTVTRYSEGGPNSYLQITFSDV